MNEITVDLEEGYKRMAADEEHEAEALEWSEGLIGDVAELLDVEWQEPSGGIMMRGELEMAITIDMTPEIEAKLRDEAAKEGLDPDRYVLHTLAERWGQTHETITPHLRRSESELLQHINEGLPAETWRQYHALIARRDAGTLTADDQKILVGLIDEVEIAHARRMKYLVELANLRETTLDELMDALGIVKPTYV